MKGVSITNSTYIYTIKLKKNIAIAAMIYETNIIIKNVIISKLNVLCKHYILHYTMKMIKLYKNYPLLFSSF